MGDYAMEKFEKMVTYFNEPGLKNTEDVIQAVLERVKEGDIKTVIVASTSGATGVRFARAFKGIAEVIAVSYEAMNSENKWEIVRLGAKALEKTHLPLEAKEREAIKNSFYTLGQGFKVAVEVILIAADKEAVTPYKDVIGVGGTDTGADTAIVARATTSEEAFGEDKKKKLEVREIIAMPLKKMWW